MKQQIKALIDLLRLHFFFAWPLLFCAGLFIGFANYGGVSFELIIKSVFIAFFGFEAGFILNDYIDRDLDTKDVEEDLTKYWRLFHTRPISSGIITPRQAALLFFVFAGITTVLILSLSYPHSLYLLFIMIYSYAMEVFYQIRKRNQTLPLAQLLGITDFTLFPVAGYLVVGHPDVIALLLFLFFYPFAIAHLGANDIVDIKNDTERKMNTVTVLYGIRGTVYWILLFSILHFITASLFLTTLPLIAWVGFIIGFGLLLTANILLQKKQTPQNGLKILPFFHVTMIIYSLSIIISLIA